jgi:hypothetical protein
MISEIEVWFCKSSWMVEELSLTSSGLALSNFGDERLREGQLVVDPEHFSETQVNTTTTRLELRSQSLSFFFRFEPRTNF